MSDPILSVKNLNTVFYTDGGIVPAVNDVSFDLCAGETLGIVGESGCGKSVTALSIMRLIQGPIGKIKGGQVLYGNQDILQMDAGDLRTVRGNEISMIFQEPMTSLNPVFTIGNQLSEVFRLHENASKKQAMEKSVEALHMVGIPAPEKRVKEYPHSLSGGMRQRVMIAMALACKPKVLICDEPTTALDVTIQAQILELMRKLQQDLGMAMIFISHDLGVIADLSDRVMVMYAGRTVEEAPVRDIFYDPAHPYSKALLNSIPKLGADLDKKLNTIPGIVPELVNLPLGCHFADRCEKVQNNCRGEMPVLSVLKNRGVRCYYPNSAGSNP